jgi:hypothetical protein
MFGRCSFRQFDLEDESVVAEASWTPSGFASNTLVSGDEGVVFWNGNERDGAHTARRTIEYDVDSIGA